MDTRVWVVCRNLSGNTTGNDGNTLSKVNRDSSFLAKFGGGIGCCKALWMGIFARRTFLRFRCCSIHVRMCVLFRYYSKN